MLTKICDPLQWHSYWEMWSLLQRQYMSVQEAVTPWKAGQVQWQWSYNLLHWCDPSVWELLPLGPAVGVVHTWTDRSQNNSKSQATEANITKLAWLYQSKRKMYSFLRSLYNIVHLDSWREWEKKVVPCLENNPGFFHLCIVLSA